MGPSYLSTTESNSPPNIKRKNCANVALHFAKTRSPPSMISMPCEREGQFTVQVGLDATPLAKEKMIAA